MAVGVQYSIPCWATQFACGSEWDIGFQASFYQKINKMVLQYHDKPLGGSNLYWLALEMSRSLRSSVRDRWVEEPTITRSPPGPPPRGEGGPPPRWDDGPPPRWESCPPPRWEGGPPPRWEEGPPARWEAGRCGPRRREGDTSLELL